MIELETGDWLAAPQALPRGEILFAIGDVHGHAPQLERIHAFIASRIETAHDPRQTTLVWLGDYVDRGRQPKECLDMVRAGLCIEGLTEVCLKGNHEQFLIEALEQAGARREQIQIWLMNGGGATIKGVLGESDWRSPATLAAGLRGALGSERVEFLASLKLQHRHGPYLFVHAGVDPTKDLAAQGEAELIWIREPFLHARDWPHDFTVIHGHTPGQPCVLPHRIGIDSGIYFSGRLTAVEIVGERLRFVTAFDSTVGLKSRWWNI